jgi:hypothetical protein
MNLNRLRQLKERRRGVQYVELCAALAKRPWTEELAAEAANQLTRLACAEWARGVPLSALLSRLPPAFTDRVREALANS